MALRKYTLALAVLIILTISLYYLQPPLEKAQDRPMVTPTPAFVKTTDYVLVFVGDSMTAALGNFDEIRAYLKKSYPDKTFLLLNYGFGSTNVLSVEERIIGETEYLGRKYQAIGEIPYDLIFIESFGHNPLSEFSLVEGLNKQTETLDKIVELLSAKQGQGKIVFVSTIAANKNRFGEGAVNLTPEQKLEWVSERDAYLKNHIDYAKAHQIPVVNIFEKSLKNGTGNIDYLNSNDFIHPSPSGIYFISKEITDFLFNEKLLK